MEVSSETSMLFLGKESPLSHAQKAVCYGALVRYQTPIIHPIASDITRLKGNACVK